MDAILTRLGLDVGDAATLLVTVLVFGTAVLAVLGLGAAFTGGRSGRHRLMTGRDADEAPGDATGSVRFVDDVTNLGPLLRPFMRHIVPTNMAELSAMRRRMIQAGYLQPSAVGYYYVVRLIVAVGTAAAVILLAPFVSREIQPAALMIAIACLSAFGYYLPSAWVNIRTDSLQRRYRESFPDALDLLVVCVEAGLALDAAISRVGNELGSAHRGLADNFQIMSLELRAGKSREDALRNLADRLGIDEVKAMVTLLLQSEELGTSIADALRVYSDEMRVKRMLRAETKAQSLPVKLALPLGLFVFPVMMIVVLLPAIIRIRNSLLTVEFG